MQLLPGSQKAVPTSFVLHALAEDGQRPRGQQQSRVRPPLQRQRPGPQRPMDGRQRQQQRPQRQTPPFKQDSGSQLQEQQGSSPADQPQQARGLQRGQQQPGSDSRVASVGGPSQQMTAVSFCLQFDTQYGQRMRLVGSHHNLGNCYAPCLPCSITISWLSHTLLHASPCTAASKQGPIWPQPPMSSTGLCILFVHRPMQRALWLHCRGLAAERWA